MRGHQVKRGVTSTLERVFQASGQRISKLQVYWTGKTAGINFTRSTGSIEAKVIFPAIDDMGEVSRPVFNNLIGFAIHELGHAWFTENEPWDRAREADGEYLSALINGLEDVRIEQRVIDSGYAENSAVLFEELINSMLDKHGYVEPDDLDNVAFMLAVEGRRLNGYHITTPTILDRSPWATDIKWAIDAALKADNTKQIVHIARELLGRLKQQHKTNPQPKQQQDGKGKQGGKQGDKGDEQQGKGGSSDKAGDKDGKQAGEGDQPADGEQGDKDSQPKKGKGKSDSPFAPENFKARRVEPDAFIKSELKSVMTNEKLQEPAVRKPRIMEINFF
jgi:hypothetical protein